MHEKKAVTIRDVARLAGVSPTTVSRYTNGTLSLPNETSARIINAIRDLDYRPNVLARSLSLGQSRTLGLVVPDIANPFFAQLASAAEREAFSNGYHLLLCSSDSDPERERTYLRQLAAKRLDGIVFITEHPDREHLAELTSTTANIILVDEDVTGCDFTKVFVNNLRGGFLATEHLYRLGHRRIAHIGGPPELMTARERKSGYTKALREQGLTVDRDLIHAGPYRQTTGRAGLREFLALPDPPTAIFAASDYIAIGVLQEARTLGVRIPRDLSLVGYDGIAIGEMLSPALTTVAQPIEDLGKQGVRALIDILQGESASARVKRLEVTLVERDSTQRAQSRGRTGPRNYDGEA